MSWLQIENKSVLITGGASGIGRVLANAFVRQNASVAIADQNIKAGKNTLDELMLNSDIEHYFFPTDIYNPKSVSQMFDAYLKKAIDDGILFGISLKKTASSEIKITEVNYDKSRPSFSFDSIYAKSFESLDMWMYITGISVQFRDTSGGSG